MNDQSHVLEYTAAYALGALSPDLARLVEGHCASCVSCAADLREMAGLASTLPLACDTLAPPARLKRRIISAARGDVSADRFLRQPSRRSFGPGPAWWAAAAAAVFVASLAMATSALIEHREMVAQVNTLHDELFLDQGAIAEIAGAQHVWDISGGAKDHWWHCTLVQPKQHKKAMLVALMPSAPHGMTFQAWVIHHGVTHNAGTVAAGTASMTHLTMPVEKGDVVAFTVEPMGGSARPTMPFAMEEQLD